MHDSEYQQLRGNIMLRTSRWILRVLNWLNWGLGIPAIIFLFALSFAGADLLAHAAAGQDAYTATVAGAEVRARVTSVNAFAPEVFATWLRWIAFIMAPIIPLAHIILTRLIAMIDSVPTGMALSLLNADRLRQIAWALIGINVLDLAFGIVTTWAEANMGEPQGWVLSLTGWLAALMLFILARVFREGAAMREELEGTV
jgi:Protein of unknown function (DUF2975)